MEARYAYEQSSNSSQDLAYLNRRRVSDFVHFTSADNLEGILNSGLAPRSFLEGIGTSFTSTDNLRLEGRDVVNLSITNPNIGMFYGKRKEHPNQVFAVLTLDPSLLLEAEGIYSFRATNAASRFSQPCNVEEVFAGDRPSFFEPNWPTDNQAELLVRGSINPRYIKTIQFPYSASRDQRAIDLAERTAALARKLGLRCSVLFSERHFDYNKSLLGQLEPKKQYKSYFVSWSVDEQAAVTSAEAIRLIEREKLFDSMAYAARILDGEKTQPDRDVMPDAAWSLKYRVPAEPAERSNAQLSAFAVIEKITNRGRRTRLSPWLEQRLGSDEEIAFAHQAQCAIVEMVKHQALGAGDRIVAKRCGKKHSRLGRVFRLALQDLQDLSSNVCRMYGCDDLMEGIDVVNNVRDANLVANWSDDPGTLGAGEFKLSGFREAPGAVAFDFTRVVEPVPIKFDIRTLRFLLNYIFRFEDFREGQVEAIRRGLRRQDTIVLLPTGSGKSVVFQLLSLITPGIAFVVCPIISLIEDQITNLRKRGIDRAMGLSSAMDSESQSTVLEGITTGQYLVCYVAPERFQNRRFNANVRRYASTNLISTVAVDEAHCVSEWGHDFRTAYLGLARTCREVCSTGDATPPLLALTGTASTSVLTDMMNDLEIKDEYAVIQPRSFDRPEIHYRVIRVPSNQKLYALGKVLDELIPRDFSSDSSFFYIPNGDASNCGIVFCPHASGSFGLMASDRALAAGHPGVWDYMESRLPGLCGYYSGSAPKRMGMGDSKWNAEKRAQASMFKGNVKTIMVATKAFGMGIDKPNVRWVVHYGMPGSLESYYQEVGRAARDRKVAYAYLLLSDDFHDLNEELLDPSRTPITEMMTKSDSRKGKWNGDDVSRVAFFHSNTFEGVDCELQAANGVLGACGRDNYHDSQWYVPFSSTEKESMERAIYRFRLLGVFEGYAIDYSRCGGTFVIKPSGYRGDALRSHIIESYLEYIRAYQSDEAYMRTAKRNVLAAVDGAVNDRDFIMRAMRHLLGSFVYKVLEEGRRRATKTMLDAANIAADAGSEEATDRELRRQMLAYLSISGHDGKRQGIRALLNDATDLGLILETLQQDERSDLLGQAARLLEDYPEHYGLHFIQAAAYALNGDTNRFGSSLRAMTDFGISNYGLGRDECKSNFVAFINSPAAKDLQAEKIEILLPIMSECFDCTEDEMLSLLTSAQATMLKEIDTLYDISSIAMEGIRWTQAS